MKLIDIQNGREVKVGDIVSTFRNELVRVTGLQPPKKAGSTGRVVVETCPNKGLAQELFPTVIGCKFVEG